MPILDIRGDRDFDEFDPSSVATSHYRGEYARTATRGSVSAVCRANFPPAVVGLRNFNIAYTGAINVSSGFQNAGVLFAIDGVLRITAGNINGNAPNIQVYRSGSWTTISSLSERIYLSTNTPYRMVIEFDFTSEGYVRWYRDGIVLFEVTGDFSDLAPPTAVYWNAAANSSTAYVSISEYILSTSDMNLHNSFVKTLIPSAASTPNDWSGDLNNVNTINGDTENPLISDAVGQESVFTITNPSLSTPIHALAVTARALTSDPTVDSLALGIQPPGNTMEYSDFKLLSGNPTIKSYVQEGVWNGATIASVRVGIESGTGGT